MNRTWHLTRFDLRRHRWAAVVMLGAIVLMLPLRSVMLESTPEAGSFMVRSIMMTLVSLSFAVTWSSLVALVMQGEPAHGAAAAWMTRPISGTRMFASRMLAFVLLGLGLPWLSQTALMIGAGCPWGAAIDSGAGTAAILGVLGCPLLLLAALTRNFARFWALLISSLMGFSVLLATWPMLGRGSSGKFASANLAAGMLTADAGFLILLWWLYRRRTARAVSFGALGWIAVSLGVAAVWPWEGGKRPDLAPRIDAPASAGVAIAPSKLAQSPLVEARPGNRRRTVSIRLELQGWTGDQPWRLGNCSGSVANSAGEVLDGKVTLRAGTTFDLLQAARVGVRPALVKLLGGEYSFPADGEVGAAGSSYVGTVTAPVTSGIGGAGKFSGQARVERIELTNFGRLPLDGSNSIRVGAQRLRVRKTEVREGRLELQLQFDTFSRAFTASSLPEQALREPIFVVCDRARAVRYVGRAQSSAGSMSIPGCSTQLRTLVAPVAAVDVANASALEEFSLIVVGEVVREWCTVPVEFPLPSLE